MEDFFHVYTKSIAGYKIFNCDSDFGRMLDALKYYQVLSQPTSLSHVHQMNQDIFSVINKTVSASNEKLVDLIAYCLMPTHIHLILHQQKENGISKFMSNVLNSYTRYFNLKHKRKGPLWQGRFKKVLIETDDQLLHLTRYIHLNPVTAYLVERPALWEASSYREYLKETTPKKRLCNYEGFVDARPDAYKKFVEEWKVDQRELADIKSYLFDDLSSTS